MRLVANSIPLSQSHFHSRMPRVPNRQLDAAARSEAPRQPQGKNSALDSTVVRPVQSAALGRLFLIDSLRLAYAANGATEPYPDIDGHRL